MSLTSTWQILRMKLSSNTLSKQHAIGERVHRNIPDNSTWAVGYWFMNWCGGSSCLRLDVAFCLLCRHMMPSQHVQMMTVLNNGHGNKSARVQSEGFSGIQLWGCWLQPTEHPSPHLHLWWPVPGCWRNLIWGQGLNLSWVKVIPAGTFNDS